MDARADIRANPLLEQGFRLSDLQIDPLADEVTGPAGCERLDPKVMDVLVLLAQHAGHVVLREDLLAQLWPDTAVTDDALSRCVYELRRHLSQAGGSEQYKSIVETVPKRGYRLHGEVTPAQPRSGGTSAFSARRRIAVVAATILIAVPLWFSVGQRLLTPTAEPHSPPTIAAAPSIAVLPFVDMSAGQDQGHLSDGISEEIINRLTTVPALRVIARTSSFAFRDQLADIPEIATKLSVTHVLEGSVRRSGNRVRITAQLIEAASNSHLWSQTFDRELGDLFTVQDEIAAAVAGALQIEFAGVNRGAAAPVSAQAHEQFLQGQFFYNRRATGDVERSVKYYEKAVATDPGYARAWAALAGAYSLLAWEGKTFAKDLQTRQGEAARKAVELDPDLAVAHARLAQFYYGSKDYKKAGEHRLRAVALDPDDPFVLGITGSEAIKRGDIGVAIAMQRRAVAQDPLATVQRTNLAAFLMADGQLDAALAEYRRALELNPDVGVQYDIEIARIYVLQGRYDEAMSAVAQLPEGGFRDHVLALLYQAPGRRVQADMALERLTAQPGDTMDIIRLAEVYAFRGMSDEAYAMLLEHKGALEHNKDRSQPRISYFQNELRLSPFLKSLHNDPRWQAMMVKPG